MDGCKTAFLLRWPIFRGYVSFREGTSLQETQFKMILNVYFIVLWLSKFHKGFFQRPFSWIPFQFRDPCIKKERSPPKLVVMGEGWGHFKVYHSVDKLGHFGIIFYCSWFMRQKDNLHSNVKIRFPCNYQYLWKHESCFVLFPPNLVVLFCIKTSNRIHGTDIFAYL